MRQVERAFQAVIFFSRWLLAPFLIGLVLCLLLLIAIKVSTGTATFGTR